MKKQKQAYQQKSVEELQVLLDQKSAELVWKDRELEVEAAMERIRNRTLLMKGSKELNESVAVFFQQFKSLNLMPAEARTISVI